MKRKHLMYRILSILLIVVTLVTSQSLVVLGETVSNSQSEPKKTGNPLIFFEPIHVKANNKNKNKVNTGKNNLKQSDYLEINNELTPITSGKVDGYVNTLGIYDVSFIDEKINLLKDSVELSITPNNINWEGDGDRGESSISTIL